MDGNLYRFDLGKYYNTFPRIDTPTCQVSPLGNDDGYTELLPTIDSTWTYRGHSSNGQHLVWEKRETMFNFTNVYKMHVHKVEQRPVRLHMIGYNFVLGSHPDEYIIDYHQYAPGSIDQTAFAVPALCTNAKVNPNSLVRARAFAGILGMHKIAAAAIEAQNDHFHTFMRQHNRVYKNAAEYHRRRSIFEENVAYIDAHNSRSGVSHKLGLNKFADMTIEEVQRVMAPNRFKSRQEKLRVKESFTYDATHKPSGQALPPAVNWVAKGAVNPPKDQGACGSCWTFGTAGSLEGAYAIKTGNLVRLSEQQILDCAWVANGDSGCDGGFAEQAMQWVKDNGGLALEQDYKYLMVDGYCKSHIQNSGVVVQSYVNVTGGEAGLMDAVANHGPVAVAINAAMKDFYYYQGGIYSNPNCDPNDRDHEVLVVGYGTENGQDYWLLKNSWGVIWGEKGFFRMARNKGNMCGVAAEARYAVL